VTLPYNFPSSLERAILETLAYSDVFDYPLTLNELHRYLTYPAAREEVRNCLETLSSVSTASDFYFLSHRSSIVEIRLQREAVSRPAFRRALFYGCILGLIPFVRMVAMTGSLAVLNLSKGADMDYMLVTETGRLWFARAFAVTFGRLMRLFGDRICVNLLVAESALEWQPQDLYSAREMCQMIPITGFETYRRLRGENIWIETYLPNAKSAPGHTPQPQPDRVFMQKISELPFRGRLGDVLEKWTMDFQIKKIARARGAGQETNFSANVCQGNFHDHRFWTGKSFQERLAFLSKGERQP